MASARIFFPASSSGATKIEVVGLDPFLYIMMTYLLENICLKISYLKYIKQKNPCERTAASRF